MAFKQALGLVFVTTLTFAVMLSCRKGAAAAHLEISLPGEIPAALNNFTAGQGNPCNFLVGVFLGVGHQEYTFNGTAWINSNVSADLYDQNVTQVAHHFFLPPPGLGGGLATWSTVIDPLSSVTAKAKVIVPQTGAVPLLLLNATANSGPLSSAGVTFGAVTQVQRLQTQGGLPPSILSNTTVGDVFFSPYSATYAFYHVP